MDLLSLHWLLSPAGQAVLAAAEALDLSDAGRLASIERLRRLATPEQAVAAFETAVLRRRAAAKFPGAERMYFTREALEQASAWPVACWRAHRYQRALGRGAHVADLCCGIGGDALAFAVAGLRVTAVDRDPVRLAMLAANTAAFGLSELVHPLMLDLEHHEPPPAGALFFDPARRSAGRRVFALADYAPPVRLVERWRANTPAVGVKVAPGVRDDELAALAVAEAEFVSLDGELKEAVLWYGALAEHGRRASVLTSAKCKVQSETTLHLALCTPDTMLHPHGEQLPQIDLSEPKEFLYEPDPAVIRAHLVALVARELEASQLDAEIAYLTADHARTTPFARCWRVLEWHPFGLKQLRARMRALDAGAVTVKKRGSPLDTDALARTLSGAGSRPLVVVLTQLRGKPIAIICEGPLSSKRLAAAGRLEDEISSEASPSEPPS
jgi:SAM-dependent methyltransferase